MDGNGLNFEALAGRLEALQLENAGLRDRVAALEGGARPDGTAPEASGLILGGRVSRRALLGRVGAAAVAAAAAGTLLTPREAEAVIREDEIYSDYIQANAGPQYNNAIFASNDHGTAVQGVGRIGVSGWTSVAEYFGVFGEHTGAAGFGVRGKIPDGDGAGVRGSGGTGVWGSSPRSGYAGVYGRHTGTSGCGVVGDGKGGSAGVIGRNGAGEGVRGEGRTGVAGKSATGYGATFGGGRAQLRLVPKTTAGRPATGTHVKGEIYMDTAGALFVCVAGTTSATAARWRQVTTSTA